MEVIEMVLTVPMQASNGILPSVAQTLKLYVEDSVGQVGGKDEGKAWKTVADEHIQRIMKDQPFFLHGPMLLGNALDIYACSFEDGT